MSYHFVRMISAFTRVPGRFLIGAGAALVAIICALALSKPAMPADPFILKKDVAYGPNLGQPNSNLLDIYGPREHDGQARPVFIWIHGGGWFQGNKSGFTLKRKARTLVRAGYVFVSVNYRLSPDFLGPESLAAGRVRFPAAHNDVASAIGWVDRNIARYGGDSNRMILGGESAGGQMAALLATKPSFLAANGVSARQVKGVLSLDGVGFDVARMLNRVPRGRMGGLARLMFNAFGTPEEERWDPRWAAASPLRFADPYDPPIFHVVPANGFDRWFEANQMAQRLGQRFKFAAMRVPTSHAGVATLLGNPFDDMGVTRKALSFFKAALKPAASVPVVRGARVVRASRSRASRISAGGRTRSGAGRIRLRITSQPRARLMTCRINRGPETTCRRSWRLRPGIHTLRVTTYAATGRASAARLETLRVLP